MRTRSLVGFALAAAFIVPNQTEAQLPEMPELGPLMAVYTWQIEPADMAKFMAMGEKIAKAAKAAKLGQDYGWTMWQNLYTVSLVGPFNRKELDDPMVWVKQFMDTPGQAGLMEAFQDMEAVDFLGAQAEIMQAMPGWSYTPTGMAPMSAPLPMVHINEIWMKSGNANFTKWNTLMADFMAFFKEIGFSYPVYGYTVRYGDARAVFVTAYDNQSEYFGAKSVNALVAKRNLGAKWQGLLTRLGELTLRGEQSHFSYLPSQSYMGTN